MLLCKHCQKGTRKSKCRPTLNMPKNVLFTTSELIQPRTGIIHIFSEFDVK